MIIPISKSKNLFPKKKLIDHIQKGKIPIDYLQMVNLRKKDLIRRGHKHGTDHDHHHPDTNHTHSVEPDITLSDSQPIVQLSHHSPDVSTVGWICWNKIIFNAERISHWLRNISNLSNVCRTKAVIRTTKGWWGVNFVSDVKEIHPNGYRRDSRIEVVSEGEPFADINTLEEQLRECIASYEHQ